MLASRFSGEVVGYNGVYVCACVCSDCVFVMLYIYMAEHWILPQQLLAISSLLTVVGYVCNIVITGFFRNIPGEIWKCE